jgi:hypothetical protein
LSAVTSVRKHEWQNKASSAHTLLHGDKNMFEKAQQKLSD